MKTESDRTCCILGGCGFLGSVVAAQLLRDGWKVRVLDRVGVDPWRLAPLLGSVELVRGDFMNQADLLGAIGGVGTVLHFLGTTIPQTSMEDIAYDIETNVLPTIRLLEQMRSLGIPRLVFASSGGTVYGPATHRQPLLEDHPTSPICAYGINKLMVEKYILMRAAAQDLRPLILRFANPYGENQDPNRPQGAVSVFLDRALSGGEVAIWGDGSVVRDYLYQEDLGEAVAALLDTPGAEGVFNVGTGLGHSLLEVLRAVEEVLGTRVSVRHLPGRSFDVPYNVLNCSRIFASARWRSKAGLQQGIRRMLQARSHPALQP